ncbi:MAG: queuosine precursor transporter [Pseudomonadota bacterium]
MSVSSIFTSQTALWLAIAAADLAFAVLLYYRFGKAGLQAAIGCAIVLANLLAPQLIQVAGIEISAGLIFYASIFFATDVLNERHGPAEAGRAVMLGFYVSIIVVVMLGLAVMLEPSRSAINAGFAADIHGAFATIINYSPRLVIGSLVAYLISQKLDVYLFDRLRTATDGKQLWLRNNISTISAQLIDSILFSLIAWWGILDLKTTLSLALATYLFKVVIAAIDTPFIYLATRFKPSAAD